MFPRARIACKFLQYYITSSNGTGHGIHSPFVYEFVRKVLNDNNDYPEYARIEKLRRKLLDDNTPVSIDDFGAGTSVASPSSRSTIASIAASAAKQPKYAQLLFRIARHYSPRYIVELGTSLGISAAYLASGHPGSQIITAEGNHALAALAKTNLDFTGLSNVKVLTGRFENILPEMLSSLPAVDLAFIDGNHRELPTLNYFHQLIPVLSPASAIVFDDIHWSREMESAWENIKNHPQVMLTIDVFFMAIVFFRPEFRVKQHFVIRY